MVPTGNPMDILKRAMRILTGDAPTGDVSLSANLETALSRLYDSIAAYQGTDVVMNAGTALTPKFAKISCSSSGANIIVAAVTSKKIRVLSYVLVANAAVNAKWQSHTTPTDLSGLLYLAANGGVSAPFSQVGHFESLSGESLDLNLSSAIAVGGHITYIEV